MGILEIIMIIMKAELVSKLYSVLFLSSMEQQQWWIWITMINDIESENDYDKNYSKVSSKNSDDDVLPPLIKSYNDSSSDGDSNSGDDILPLLTQH